MISAAIIIMLAPKFSSVENVDIFISVSFHMIYPLSFAAVFIRTFNIGMKLVVSGSVVILRIHEVFIFRVSNRWCRLPRNANYHTLTVLPHYLKL